MPWTPPPGGVDDERGEEAATNPILFRAEFDRRYGAMSADLLDATLTANAALNRLSNIEWREVDAFDALRAFARERERFDTIVLDPPAFAKHRGDVAGALRGYREINLRGKRYAACVHLEDGNAPFKVRTIHHDGAVEAARTK